MTDYRPFDCSIQIMATTQSSSPWPENPIPEPVKALILGFYSIVDVKSDNEGVQLADKIFADQGVMKNGAKVSKGRDGQLARVCDLT